MLGIGDVGRWPSDLVSHKDTHCDFFFKYSLYDEALSEYQPFKTYEGSQRVICLWSWYHGENLTWSYFDKFIFISNKICFIVVLSDCIKLCLLLHFVIFLMSLNIWFNYILFCICYSFFDIFGILCFCLSKYSKSDLSTKP